MKHIIHSLILPLIVVMAYVVPTAAQNAGLPPIMITEIMYNPPETSNDTLEFIEIYNASASVPINLSGYHFSSGIDFTFAQGTFIQPGGFVLVSGDSVIFEAAYGLQAFTWEGATTALSNDGEGLTLRDANGFVSDSVWFDDNTSWPAVADGEGASLMLCDVSSDNNLPASWAAATSGTGIVVNSVEILANPGSLGTCTSVGIEDAASNITSGLSIYPNPSNGSVSVTVDAALAENATLSVYNPLGQVVLQRPVTTLNSTIDLTGQPGIYLIELRNAAERRVVRSIITD